MMTRGICEVSAKSRRDVSVRKQAEESLRQSEERLAAIIGSAMDAIITVDKNQRIIVFNAAAEKIFGCPADRGHWTNSGPLHPGAIPRSSPQPYAKVWFHRSNQPYNVFSRSSSTGGEPMVRSFRWKPPFHR